MAHESEYVRLGNEEQQYGKRTLLEFELGFFELIKQFGDYKKIRQQSQLARLGIKKSVAALHKDLGSLDKLLPEVHDEHHKPTKKIIAGQPLEHRPKTLDDEIAEIKNKLARLQGN